MSTRLDPEGRLYPVAFTLLRLNFGPSAAAALLLLATNIGAGYLDAPLAFIVLRALVIMIVGYAAYRTLTSGGRTYGWRAVATADGHIPWRYAGVMLMILSPILILGIVWNAPGGRIGPDSLGEIGFGLVMILLYAALYVLLGTALPEVAATGHASLGEAITRGRAHYREIAQMLVIGPWLFRAGALLILIAMALAGVTVDLFGPHGELRPAAFAPTLFLTSAHVFAEILTAVVLTRAWRRWSQVAPEQALAA